MKSVVGLLAAGLLATSLIPLEASGASLLGGLVKTGNDSGNSSEIVSLGSGDGGSSIGLLGSSGISVNLPLGGGDSVPVVDDVVGGGGGSAPIVGDLLGGGSGGSLPIVGDLFGGDNGGSLPIVGDLLGGDSGGSLPIVGDLLGGDSGGSLPIVGDLLGGDSSGSLPIVGDLLGGNGGGSLPVVGDLLGGNGVTLPIDLGSVDVGVPELATITTSPSQGGGSSVGVELLGGGGGHISTNPLGLLGNGGVSVSLPGLGGLLPGDDDDDNGGGGNGNGGNGNGGGGNGGNGGAGGNGGNGGHNGNGGGSGGNGGGNGGGHGGNGGGSGGGSGGNGNGNGGGSGGNGGGNGGGSGSGNGGSGVIVKYFTNNSGSGNGNSFAIPSGISSRLQALLRILAERDYLRVSNGRAVCLNSFAVAEVAGWLPQKDWGALQKALASYSQDIYVLRQLLANCRSAGQRQALNLTQLNRVIAIDIGRDGKPVLFML